MTGPERGILLLCCNLGDSGLSPMTMAQFRELSKRASAMGMEDGAPLKDIERSDLVRLGYTPDAADRIVRLLSREVQLEQYLTRGERCGIYPLTRISGDYPARLIQMRGMSCPPLFFCAGNTALLKGPCISLVGSRALGGTGAVFAKRAGELAAKEGFTLVNGGAEGADTAAMNACLSWGGTVILFVPDDLRRRAALAGPRCLVLSESGYNLTFTPARALTRNAYIHIMGQKTLVAQVGYGVGGTWSGAVENLKHGWSPLFVCQDGSKGACALVERGGEPVQQLTDLASLRQPQKSLFE